LLKEQKLAKHRPFYETHHFLKWTTLLGEHIEAMESEIDETKSKPPVWHFSETSVKKIPTDFAISKSN